MLEKGVEFKGGSLHDSFGGFGPVLKSTLPSLSLVLQNTGQRGNRDAFGSFGDCGGFGRDGYPPYEVEINPLSDILKSTLMGVPLPQGF